MASGAPLTLVGPEDAEGSREAREAVDGLGALAAGGSAQLEGSPELAARGLWGVAADAGVICGLGPLGAHAGPADDHASTSAEARTKRRQSLTYGVS